MGNLGINIEEFKRKAQERYEREVATDPRQKDRLARHECKACYYQIRINGQAFTQYTCQMCGKEDMHNNTGVPKICDNCADKNVLCARCLKPRD